jgi:diguanylate cyclase (GGDEF)-like protein
MDMIVDVRTVVFISLCAFAVMALFLAWSWRTQGLGNALGWWSAAFAFATVDALLFFLAPQLRGPFGSLDEIAFIAAAFALWFGFRSLNEAPIPLLPAATIIAIFAAVAALTDTPAAVVHAASVLIAIVIVALMARDVIARGDGGHSWRIAAMALVGIHGTILGLRTVLDDGQLDETVVSLETLSETLFMLEPVLMPMALGYVFLGLAYDRQHRGAVAETGRDPLTGLLNRRGLDRWITRARTGPVAVIIADIDHFKRVNDTAGHETGDRVLVAVADRLAGEVRAVDALARLGGEEFCILMSAPVAAALDAAERMRRAIAARPAETARGPIAVTASFGVAAVTGRPDARTVSAAIAAADAALYDAKRGGRDRVAAAPMVADAFAPATVAPSRVSSST